MLRERGRRPFSADEAAAAESLVAPLTLALKEFACRLPLHPIRRWSQPATLVVGADGELTMTTGPHGWMAFHAEAVEPDTCADVVITIQPASAELLLTRVVS